MNYAEVMRLVLESKYVFVIKDASFPSDGLERCCIFDNFEDAQSFYREKGYYLELYGNYTMFSIAPFVVSNTKKVKWHGDLYKGLYY